MSLKMLDELTILDPVSDKMGPFIEVGQLQLSFHVSVAPLHNSLYPAQGTHFFTCLNPGWPPSEPQFPHLSNKSIGSTDSPFALSSDSCIL